MTETTEIESEAKGRHAHDGKAPKAEKLLADLIGAAGARTGTARQRLENMALAIGFKVERGQEVEPEEEARVRAHFETWRPGIYPGLSFSEYHLIDAAHHSTLEGFARSAAHARELMLWPKDPTAALALGHAFHVALLEPERYAQEYVVPPKVDRRTKLGKASWAEWEAAHPAAILLEKDEADHFARMRESVMGNATARELLTGPGASEFCIVWNDEETGVLCKGRPDRIGGLGGYSFVVDVKTSRDARDKPFSKDAGTYGYFRQLAMYRDGLATLRPAPPRRCAIIAVEKEPPYACAVHELDDRALAQGQREYRAHLATLKRCKETGIWPSYDEGLGLIDYPSWLTDNLDVA